MNNRPSGLQLGLRDAWSGLKEASLNGPWQDKSADILNREAVEALTLIYARGFVGSNFDWLELLPKIRALRVINNQPTDVSSFAKTKELRYLYFTTRYAEKLDLATLPQLTHLSAYWMRSFRNLESLNSLVDLYAGQIPKKSYPWLRYDSAIANARYRTISSQIIRDSPVPLLAKNLELQYCSNLESLCGLEESTQLRKLTISHAPRLADLSVLQDCVSLKYVEIEHVRYLEHIELPPCGQLAALKFRQVGMSPTVRQKIDHYLSNCMDSQAWMNEPIVWPP